ncbi:Acg family FMN-binding oxidoreductase [Amorphoplanes digitatis]|uniref:Nitroreductase n=1 Tax=Actinoplanes digitatis TaxID=1868 RepID=A0A7W7HVI9_9ACTN|nr:nitroreductase [Actinoplanes digitatis]MBB4761550.1 nitroreductase [Actinoplanes digitatis]BFE70088.1 NAD(P)H nitroreductase [Actinoplanes digitatis]GID90658.1 putative NAD(P)H nitroreductase [Actinoplanes digitatis]
MTAAAAPRTVDAEARALSNAATIAGKAPSIHNTQPWRWRITSTELDLYLDRSRGLEVTDPDSRLAVLSCGAALHHALVSLAAAGWHTLIAYLPDLTRPDHLAQLRLDHRIPVTPSAIRHLRTIGLRHTDRRPTPHKPVDADQLRSIVSAVESAGAGIHLLRPDQVYDLATAADHAQRTEVDEASWQAELGYWTGGTRPLGSGIPDSAIPDQAPRTTVPGRDFGHRGDLPVSEAHDRAAVFGILYGPEDGTLGWLRAGEALSAAWLTAAEHGVSVLPLSATIEVAATRECLRHLLADLGHPHLVLRFGAPDPADGAPPHTPRLPTSQIIERV